MTGHPFRCRTCQRGSPYVFCSNDCFRKSPTKKSRSACAACSDRDGIRGNLDTNRLCPLCHKDPANVDWVRTPRREYNGFDADVFEAASGGIEQTESLPYRGKRAKRVLRLIAGGLPYREIAILAKCSVWHVDRVSNYWNSITDGALKRIRITARKKRNL